MKRKLKLPFYFLGLQMRVLMRFVGSPYKTVGISDIWFYFDKNKVTVREVLAKLEMENRVKLNLQDPSIVILVNGRHIEYMGGLDAEVKNSDKIVVASFVAGG
jgi:molybdopterin converting factor small subunit